MRSLLLEIPFWLPIVGRFEIPIHAYGVMLVFGLFAALLLGARLSRDFEPHLTVTQVMDLMVVAMLCGVVGSRLLYIFQNLSDFIERPGAVLRVWEGGLAFHGGVAGGALGVIWFLRKNKLPVIKTGDLLMPCLLMGLAWGRIGCFMNGCCYGTLCNLPWGVTFPENSPAHLWHQHLELIQDGTNHSLRVHPSQIYSSLTAVALCLLLVWVLSRKKFDGQVMAAAAMVYGVARFLLQFFRDDDLPVLVGLARSQLFSLALLAFGFLLYWKLTPRNAAEEA